MTDHDRPTVLVIDDEHAIADLYADWLSEEYDVRTAYDGEEAIEVLDPGVDVILLDRRMPGQSGDVVLEEIRTRGLDARVAMVTAVSPDFDVVEMGFDDYLVKPVTGEELTQTVERMLRISDYDDELRAYYALVTKKALLESERPQQMLEGSEEYDDLCHEVEAARERLDAMGNGFDAADFDSLLRGLDRADEGFSATS